KELDLPLRIQADRMHDAVINPDEVEAERGAVITELHSYENDPALVLNDAVNATTFLQHPYRNNTIGWLTDVQKLTHDDILQFYRRYYQPANAVLAIAGDVSTADALSKVHQYFDAIPGESIDTEPRTVEPVQVGERTITILGQASSKYFQI